VAAYLRTVLVRPLPDPGAPAHASREAPHAPGADSRQDL
jgi:hypothetical protein